MTISIALKNRMRVLFKEHHINSRGMTDDEMQAKYDALTTGEDERSPKELHAKPARTPKRTPRHDDNDGEETKELATTTTTTTTTTGDDVNMNSGANNAEAVAKIAELIGQLTPKAPAAPAFDEKRLIELIREYGTKSLEIKPRAKREKITIDGAHAALEDIIIFMQSDTMPYLCGPAGSGKTTLAIQAATAFGLDFYSTGAVTAPYELVGHNDANSNYISPALRQAFEHGGVFLFDEIDACSARALVAINQLLGNDRFTFPDGVVEKHVDFLALAAANTKGKGATREYCGRNPLDGASLDRFVELDIEYDQALELRIALAEYEAHGGTETHDAVQWVARVQTARMMAARLSISALITPRASKFGAALLANGMHRDKIDKAVLFKGLSNDAIKQLQGALL